MDEKVQILLGTCKNVHSVDVDNYQKIELENKPSQILEYDIRNALSATEIFDAEREASQIYRIYGRIEYLSLLNGLITNYNSLSNFFLPQTSNVKNIYNSFNFYLVRPSTGYTKISGGLVSPLNGITLANDFKNWISDSPSDYPEGWTVSATTGSYVAQSSATQAKFTLAYTYQDSVTLTKNFSPVYGNFTINTGGSITPYYAHGTDFLLIKIWSNDALIYTFDVLSETEYDIFYNFSLPESTPLTKITVTAISRGKTIYMNYFNLYQNSSNSGAYVRFFEVIGTPSDFEIYNAGYSNNVYNEQTYAFNFNKDFDVTPYVDEFGFPPTELFLYAQYQPKTNGNNPPVAETMSGTTWNNDGSTSKAAIFPVLLSAGTRVYGDLVEYAKSQFFQEQASPQTYYISTPYKDSGGTRQYLQWKYNPFIPFRLRYFNDELNRANTGSTSYAQASTIPYYATSLGDGNYVWKNILRQGYIDPITNLGVDYPFINGRRYLFSTIVFDVSPDISNVNSHTYKVFKEIKFGAPTIVNTSPQGDINNIGKPCL